MLKGKVERLVPGGDAMVHISSQYSSHRTCLVRQAVPDDIVVLSNIDKQKNMLRASLESVEIASSKRVNAPCSAARTCGGCALQYLHENEHATVKSEWVYAAFSKVMTTHSHCLAIEQLDMRDERLKRRRLRWHVGKNKHKQVVLGFRAYQSHDVIEVDTCMVVTTGLDILRKTLQSALNGGAIALPESVYAVQLSDGIHVVFEYAEKCAMDAIPDIAWQGLNLQYWCRDKLGLRALSKPVDQFSDMLPSIAEDIAVNIGPDDFVQGQEHGNRMMIEQILLWSEGAKHVVDLFSGVGNLSLPLAASGMHVLGAEVNHASVRVANSNAKRLKLSASYQQADLFSQFDISPFVGADVLLVDPPRKGAKNICSLMNHLFPKKVILVHCDVNSAAYDAQEMHRQGYSLQALRALDLFPYSGHVESMSLWTQ